MIVSALGVRLSWGEHRPWMTPYKSPGGSSCYGDVSCVPATVVPGPDGEVVTDGVPPVLPPGFVDPAPVEGDTEWWCDQGHAPCLPPGLAISTACARCVFMRRTPGDISRASVGQKEVYRCGHAAPSFVSSSTCSRWN